VVSFYKYIYQINIKTAKTYHYFPDETHIKKKTKWILKGSGDGE
jgi:hypothetical protein